MLAISGFSAQAHLEPDQSNAKNTSEESCAVQGEPLSCYGPAYNASAACNVHEKSWKYCPSDITSFVDVAFTYWYAGEEGLGLAQTGVLTSGGTSYYGPNVQFLSQSSGYKPGFPITAGIIGYHNWELLAKYTWFRGTYTTTSPQLPSGTAYTAGSEVLTGTAAWSIADWFLQGPGQNQALLTGASYSSAWRPALDLIDGLASRPYYHGPHFVVSSFGGLRVALIRQSMNVSINQLPGDITAGITNQPLHSHTHSNSWAIGPRAGCQGRCLLPMRLRIEGDLAASLLYTR